MSKYIFTNKKICNVWLQATKNINWNMFKDLGKQRNVSKKNPKWNCCCSVSYIWLLYGQFDLLKRRQLQSHFSLTNLTLNLIRSFRYNNDLGQLLQND